MALGVAVAAIVGFFSIRVVAAILVPYFCFSIYLIIWSYNKAPRVIRDIAYRTPILFLVFEVGYIVLEFVFNVSLARNVVGLAGLLTIVSTYVIILGYLYVFLMELGYFSYLHQKRHSRQLRSQAK